MKRKITLLITLVVCLSLSACWNHGTTNNAEIDYGSSVVFNEAEIKSAVDTVLRKFREFEGCDLIRIWYDEERSDRRIEQDISSGGGNTIKNSGAEPENVIILFSDFYVDASGGDGSFEPNSTYTNYNWILIRDSTNSRWRLVDWGY